MFFRSAAQRESDLAEHRFAVHMDHWKWTADQWFDGTVASVDERIAKLDNVLRFARDVVARRGSTGAGFLCGNALPNLEQSRRELAAVRDSLLQGFSDRQAGRPTPAGRRTAKGSTCPICGKYLADEYARLGHSHEGGQEFNAPPQGGGESLGEYQKRFFGSLERAIVLGSRDFVAEQNTEDHEELLTRARRYAAEETSTLPIPIAREIAAAFVGRVEELIARRPRKRQAAKPITHYEDFDDQLIY